MVRGRRWWGRRRHAEDRRDAGSAGPKSTARVSGRSQSSALGPIGPYDLSCCCPAAPVVKVLLPGPAGGPRVDLLLCAHHYREHHDALTRAGGRVYESCDFSLDLPAPQPTNVRAEGGGSRV